MMVTLSKYKYKKVLPLLETVPFNVLMARGVASGLVRGTILADNPDIPQSCYIRHPYGMSFLIGYCDDESYRCKLEGFLLDSRGERKQSELLQVYPSKWHEVIRPHVVTGVVRQWGRVNFRFNPSLFERLPPLPQDTGSVVPITAEHLKTMTGRVIPDFFWDSHSDFLFRGAGYSYMKEKVLSLAFSSYIDHRFLEIGIETLPEHRGKGHAQRVCRRLITHCLERNLEPVWSCRLENTGSYRLALKLGFEDTIAPPHPYYELPRRGALQ